MKCCPGKTVDSPTSRVVRLQKSFPHKVLQHLGEIKRVQCCHFPNATMCHNSL